MTIPILLGVLFALVAVAYVLYPLLRPAFVRDATSGEAQDVPEPEEDLAARRAELYREIVDLDFDVQVGKLAAADYQQLRAGLLRRAADLLRAQDHGDEDLDRTIEEEIAAIRRARAVRRDGFCRRCGKPFPPEDAFCSRCGTARSVEPETMRTGGPGEGSV